MSVRIPVRITYQPKEEPMLKREPVTVHIGRIVRLDWDEGAAVKALKEAK